MAKKDNTIFLIVGIVLVLLLFNYQKQDGMIGLTPHYYKDGVEVFPSFSLFSFSIVTPPGEAYDQIAFSISATNQDVPITDIQVVDAYPQVFEDSLAGVTSQSLEIDESKVLWTSEPMDALQFESISPVNFWIELSGHSEDVQETIYPERAYSGNIMFTPESEHGTLIFTTTEKHYGIMTEGIDYNVNEISNILYLFPDKEYDFTNIEIGEGTLVKLDSSVTEGAVLYINTIGTATINGMIDVSGDSNSMAYGNSAATTWDSITGPGQTSAGGSGGKGGDVDEGNYDDVGGSGGIQFGGYGGGGGGGGAVADNHHDPGGSGGNGGINPSFGIGGYILMDGATLGGHGSQSGGGGGAGAINNGGTLSDWAQGGDGALTYGSLGGNGHVGVQITGTEAAAAGGGGGAGGVPGKQGLHFYLYADTIDFSGTIDTSGGDGQRGGNGGNADADESDTAAGGGGAGGGGGGANSGNIKFNYITLLINTGTINMYGGYAGGGGSGGTPQAYGGVLFETGTNGDSGNVGVLGTFTSIQI